MIFYRLLLGIDIIAALIAVFFLLWGISDGSVSAFNLITWIVLLAGIGGVVAGGMLLKAKGLIWPATGLLLVVACPVFFTGLFAVAVIVLNPRWN